MGTIKQNGTAVQNGTTGRIRPPYRQVCISGQTDGIFHHFKMNVRLFQDHSHQYCRETVRPGLSLPKLRLCRTKQKPPNNRGFSERVFGSDLLSHGRTTLSSALSRFTVLFGMGRRGTNSLWPPNLNCYKSVKP